MYNVHKLSFGSTLLKYNSVYRCCEIYFKQLGSYWGFLKVWSAKVKLNFEGCDFISHTLFLCFHLPLWWVILSPLYSFPLSSPNELNAVQSEMISPCVFFQLGCHSFVVILKVIILLFWKTWFKRICGLWHYFSFLLILGLSTL